MGTPRRLALRIRGLASASPTETRRSWVRRGALRSETTALRRRLPSGFAQEKHGVDVSRTGEDDATDKGDYVSVRSTSPARMRTRCCPKSSRNSANGSPSRSRCAGGRGDIAFGRPIHWIVSLLGTGGRRTFEFAGVSRPGERRAGTVPWHPSPSSSSRRATTKAALENAHVVVDIDERKGE